MGRQLRRRLLPGGERAAKPQNGLLRRGPDLGRRPLVQERRQQVEAHPRVAHRSEDLDDLGHELRVLGRQHRQEGIDQARAKLGQCRSDAGVLVGTLRIGQHAHQRPHRGLSGLSQPDERLESCVRRGRVEILDQTGDPLRVLQLPGPGLEHGVGQFAALGGQVLPRPEFEEQAAAELLGQRGEVVRLTTAAKARFRKPLARSGRFRSASNLAARINSAGVPGRRSTMACTSGHAAGAAGRLGRRGGLGGAAAGAATLGTWRRTTPTSTAPTPRSPAISRVGSASAW